MLSLLRSHERCIAHFIALLRLLRLRCSLCLRRGSSLRAVRSDAQTGYMSAVLRSGRNLSKPHTLTGSP